MNFFAGIFNKVTHFYNWFSDNSNGRAVNKRKRNCIDLNENISPFKRRKILHSYTQTECFGGGPFLQYTTRADKIQSMIGPPNKERTFYLPSSKTNLRPPLSWDVKMDTVEFSSDEDSNDIQVLEEIPPRSRNPLVSLPVANGSSSSATDNNGVQVLEFKKKGKNIRLNGSSAQVSFHTSTPALPHSSIMHRKTVANGKSDVSRVKNHSIDRPRVHTLNLSFQIESKEKYGALLKSVLDQSAPSTPSFANLQDVEKKVQCSYRPRRSCSTKKINYIDLTESKEKRRHNYLPVQSNDDGDSDIEVIPIEPVPRQNSYEKKLKSCKFMMPEWIKELQASWNDVKEETTRQSRELEIKKNLYSKRNQEQLDGIEERVRRFMTVTDTVVLDEAIEDEDVSLPELTPEMEERISAALVPRPPNEVIAEGFSLKITRKDMHTLAKLNWLNDEVINFYMNLLIERGKKDKMPKVYAFNTFFYPTLVGRGYGSLKRWTRKIDIFAHDLIVVPVHLGVHWCVAIVDFREKIIEYYDSMGHPNNKCLSALLKYLQDESLDKKNTSYDTSSWNTKNMTDIPQQMNGSDCGMFACTFAEYKCRNAKINFSQQDMPYFRRKMVYEILTGHLLISKD